MPWLQHIIKHYFPKKLAQSIEKESQQWKVKCVCGQEKSIWEIGGVRWKAKGNTKRLTFCSQCNKRQMMTVYKSDKGKV